jgi:hypothetical protein
MVDFVDDLAGYPNLGDVFVSGLGRASKPTANTVRLVFYTESEARNGVFDREPNCHVVLDREAFLEMVGNLTEMAQAIVAEPSTRARAFSGERPTVQ